MDIRFYLLQSYIPAVDTSCVTVALQSNLTAYTWVSENIWLPSFSSDVFVVVHPCVRSGPYVSMLVERCSAIVITISTDHNLSRAEGDDEAMLATKNVGAGSVP